MNLWPFGRDLRRSGSYLAGQDPELSPEVTRRVNEAIAQRATKLDLSDLRITWLPEELAQLTRLQHLDVSRNNLVSLPGFLGNLKELFEVDASNNQLGALPSSLGYLKNLQRLDVSQNHLTIIPESIGSLKNLQYLAIGGKQLGIVPDWVRNLTHLRHLDLNGYILAPDESAGDGRLIAIPDWIGELAQLEFFDVSGNQLMALPKSLRKLTALRELYLHGNGALRLPREVLGPMSNEVGHENAPASPASILGYYFRVGRGKRILNEAKLIVVGRGGVGKTCLIKRLIRDTFDKSEPETSGVEIQVWPVELPNDAKIRLHIWDFGGQEILHATHQLFLTERTLYLLVLSGREGNSTQDAEYWLQLIRSFGGTSRVVIALNKYVEHPFDVNRGLLVEKYPSVAEFVETDCADPAMGLLELKRVIFQHVGNSELCRVDFPLEWFAIKERLAEMTSHGENFLTWTRFQEICGQLGEGDPEQQQQLAKYLHVLGIALNYRDEPRLRDHHVLNPNWVTTGIYTLLRTGQKRSGDLRSNSSNRKRINPSAVPKESRQIGVLTAADLATSLDSRRYPSTCHEFLLQLMEKFQLCFRLPGVEKRYLVPELLSANQPDIALLLEEPCLRFQYQYEILPEGLLPRFIVQTHIYSETTSHLRWRTGVVLEREGCSAVVRTDDRERRVDIYVTGLETRRRELLAIARASFEEQHFDLKGLIVAERVPIPGMLSATVSYRKLLSLEDRGETHYEPENLDTPVRVSRLLGGIESPKSRKRRQRVTMRPIKVRPIHISKVKGKVHVAIITVRPDEYDAVESRLGDSLPVEGGNNSYEHAFVNQETGDDIRVVLTRCVGQGNTAAQGVANNIVQDIDPSWILLVGIAGGVADHEYSLGDVILASSLHDFSFGAALEGSSRTYQATGGYMHQDVIRFLQTRIVGKNRDRLLNLAGFTTDENFMRHPPLFPFNEDHGNAFYGERDFRIQVAKKLESRFPAGLRKGGPLVWPGPCANGNLLVKDSKLLKEWQSTARQVVAMETELAGVYECARSAGRQNYPLLAIRGLSDIVGLRRNADWTEYACNTAAALACAVLRSGLIDFSTNLPKSWNKHSEDDSNG